MFPALLALPPLLAALEPKPGAPLLFNAHQKDLSGCYPSPASLVYDGNVGRITVRLSPLPGGCAGFPRGATARLVLGSPEAPAALERLLPGFNYEETREITFEAAPALRAEAYAVLYLYSLSSAAAVAVSGFSERKSSLSACYDSIDIIIEEESVDISLDPSGACARQIGQSAASELRAAVLTINGVEFPLNPAEISAAYAQKTTIEADFAIEAADLALVRAAPARAARLQLTAAQGGRALRFSAAVRGVESPGLRQPLFDVEGARVGLFQDIIIVYAALDEEYWSGGKEHYGAVEMTRYVARLVVDVAGRRVVLQNAFSEAKFDENRRIYEFRCAQGSAAEQEACAAVCAQALSERAQFTFSLLFYNGEQYLFSEEMRPRELLNCFQSLVAQRGSSACFEVILRKNAPLCDAAFPQDSSVRALVTARVVDVLGGSDLSAPAEASVTAAISRTDAQFCFPCSDGDQACARLERQIGSPGLYYYVTMEVEDQESGLYGEPLGAIGARVANTRYLVVKAVTFSLGGLIILLCLITSVISMLAIMKSIRESKKRRK